jgi:hypothetical protein
MRGAVFPDHIIQARQGTPVGEQIVAEETILPESDRSSSRKSVVKGSRFADLARRCEMIRWTRAVES